MGSENDMSESKTVAARTGLGDGGSSVVRGAVVGVLIGFQDDGRTPLVIFPGQPGNVAVPARSTERPIIVGCMHRADGWGAPDRPVQVEVDVDGERMVVTAKDELVLQCGKASITLTRAGKILIRGTYVSNQSSGVMRIKGGSVQLN